VSFENVDASDLVGVATVTCQSRCDLIL